MHGDEAIKQVCTLAGILDATFKKGYDNIFETWIEVGDAKALSAWTDWANRKKDALSQNEETMIQAVNDIGSCYKDAYDEELLQEYEIFFKKIAAQTGGCFERAPMKTPLRAVEKTAFRHDTTKRRWKCDNVYDVMRGAISYPSMEGIKAGVSLPPLPLIFFIFDFSFSLEGGAILSPNLFHFSLSFFSKGRDDF